MSAFTVFGDIRLRGLDATQQRLRKSTEEARRFNQQMDRLRRQRFQGPGGPFAAGAFGAARGGVGAGFAGGVAGRAAGGAAAGFAGGVARGALGGLGAAAVGVGIAATAKATIQAGIDFEFQLKEIQKVTGITGDALEDLGNSILDTASAMGIVSRQELAAIAIEAGRAGIKSSEGIKVFTKTVAELAATSDLSAEEAGNSLARLTRNFELNIESAENLSSAITVLARNATATEGEIAQIATRISQSANVLGLTAEETLAIATTLRNAGIGVELAGTNLSNILAKLAQNSEAFANLTGMTDDAFVKLLSNNPIDALIAIAQALEQMKQQRGAVAVFRALEDLGLEGARASRVLFALAKNTDEFRAFIERANQASRENNATTQEAAQLIDTAKGAIGRASESFGALAISVDEFLGSNKAVQEFFQGLTQLATDLVNITRLLNEGVSLTDQMFATLTQSNEGIKAQLDLARASEAGLIQVGETVSVAEARRRLERFDAAQAKKKAEQEAAEKKKQEEKAQQSRDQNIEQEEDRRSGFKDRVEEARRRRERRQAAEDLLFPTAPGRRETFVDRTRTTRLRKEFFDFLEGPTRGERITRGRERRRMRRDFFQFLEGPEAEGADDIASQAARQLIGQRRGERQFAPQRIAAAEFINSLRQAETPEQKSLQEIIAEIIKQREELEKQTKLAEQEVKKALTLKKRASV